MASAETEIDVATFIAWADAHGRGEFELARFHEDRFREEFVPAFEAWMAADPFEDPNAPATPFAMDDYRVAAEQHAEELDEQAEDGAAAVRRNIQQAGDYMLAVVLFAVALFFGGMSSKLASVRLRAAMVACGYVVLLGTLVWVASAPISLHS
ncbi:MAG: hypothetical protein M5U19_19460 [Microthrixaceae bacterium]|nr:hypothetical protein [Microthrixaceae bacterium]